MQEEQQSIFLIGMPGAGKSTLGRLLSVALQMKFVDVDRELEARAGTTIATIFEVEGEVAFRRREAALIDELTKEEGIVLATGGGAVLLPENRAHLRARGFVVYLQSSLDELLRRTQHDKSRPLLQGGDIRARLEQLLAVRGPLYESIAHLTIHSGPGSAKKLVKRIVDAAKAGVRTDTL